MKHCKTLNHLKVARLFGIFIYPFLFFTPCLFSKIGYMLPFGDFPNEGLTFILLVDSLPSFPPQAVQLKKPFRGKPWSDSEENVGKLLMVPSEPYFTCISHLTVPFFIYFVVCNEVILFSLLLFLLFSCAIRRFGGF